MSTLNGSLRAARIGRLAALTALLVCAAVSPSRATSFEAVTFNDLVARADVIFIGDVLDVRPFTVATPTGDLIKTRVTFVVRDALWGTTSSMESFEFLGGVINGKGLRVAEMPTFAPGDRRVVFARRDGGINPIVGFTQGLMRVTRDGSGVDAVLTSEGAPLPSAQEIGRPRTRLGRAMPLSDLRAQIVNSLKERRR